jgi:hypothetical protein
VVESQDQIEDEIGDVGVAAQRMRHELKLAAHEDRTAGRGYGIEWGKSDATRQQLLRLSELLTGDAWEQLAASGPVGELVVSTIEADCSADDFWRDAAGCLYGGNLPLSDAWILGFVEGAVAVWDRIDAELRKAPNE